MNETDELSHVYDRDCVLQELRNEELNDQPTAGYSAYQISIKTETMMMNTACEIHGGLRRRIGTCLITHVEILDKPSLCSIV